MCHEKFWRERRARAEEESREVWLDFERTAPADEPDAEPEPKVVLEKAEDDVVAADQ